MTLRELFIQWLTASRFIQSLEARYQEQRQDFTERLAEKDARIKELRAEIAAMRMHVPYNEADYRIAAQKPAPPLTPEFSGPDSWDAELNRMYKEDSNGIRSEGRKEVNQSTADDGSQP